MVISAPSARGKDLPQQSLHDWHRQERIGVGMTLGPIARELNLAETAFVLPATREDSMDRIPPHLLSGAH
jgi:hypothetical protein